jgi:hypothetical protein
MIFIDSRYEKSSVVPIADTRGRYRATIVPCCQPRVPDSFTLHLVLDGERLDMLAAGSYGDSEMWWRIADANPELFFPDDIPAGTLLRIPAYPMPDD